MGTPVHGDDVAASMGLVATMLLGAPNRHLSTDKDVRYGHHGSVHVNLAAGTFYDHEAKSGGGVLDLISRQLHCDHRGAVEWLRDNGFLEKQEPMNGHAKPKKREIAAYDYTDENGEVLFQVVRFEPKTFLQRKMHLGQWTYKVQGTRQVPYRLPDLIEAIANGRTIFIVEGEKDVENLARHNIPATCNPGGAGKWRQEFSEFFRDADVVVIPDNDTAGRDHAEFVSGTLVDIARSVRRLDLPNLPNKGDVSDWIAAGGTPEALHSLVEKAPRWTQRVNSRFGGLRWEDIGRSTSIVGYEWLIEDIIPLGEITLVYGDSGTGKSFDMFDMGMCVSRGTLFNGRNVEPGAVVYVAAEAGKGFAKRKIAYSIQHKLESGEAVPFYLCTKRPNFFHDDTDALALIEEIKAVAKSYAVPLRLIVVDTLSALAPGMNENASQDVSMVRKRLVMLQDQFDAAVVLIHHKPKNGSTPRGHGSLTADFETTIEFETLLDRKTPEGKTIHRATVRKQREGKSGITWHFTLPIVDVGRNKWGNPETSCVVLPLAEQSRANAIGFHATPAEKRFLHALYEALLSNPLPPPAGLPKTIAHVVHEKDVRQAMRDRFINPEDDPVKADQRFRQAFKRAADVLYDGAVIGKQGELMWPTGKPVNGFSEKTPCE